MGKIYDDHGNVSIEGRRESFVIHAGYASKIKESKIRELQLMERFTQEGIKYELTAMNVSSQWEARAIDTVQGGHQAIVKFGVDTVVSLGYQVHNPDHPLSANWGGSHPEFPNEDLGDLIDALTEYRDHLGGQNG